MVIHCTKDLGDKQAKKVWHFAMLFLARMEVRVDGYAFTSYCCASQHHDQVLPFASRNGTETYYAGFLYNFLP